MAKSILLIGAGGWGGVHRGALNSVKGWRVGAIADADRAVLDASAKELKLGADACFTDASEAIDAGGCDLIAVVVRNPARLPILEQALRTGKPVFVEKPIVHDGKSLRRVYTAAKAGGGAVAVSQNYRFEPQMRRLREFIAERRTWGAVRNISVRFSRNMSGWAGHAITKLPGGLGLGAEMCVHHYDLLRYLLGENPSHIRATARRGAKSVMQGWSMIDAWIEFPSGVFVRYAADYDAAYDRTPWGGVWDFDFDGGALTATPYADGKIPMQLHSPLSGRWQLVRPSDLPATGYPFHLVDRSFASFAEALANNAEPECSLRDNVQTLALMLAINEAARTGRTIDFPKFLEGVAKECPSSRRKN